MNENIVISFCNGDVGFCSFNEIHYKKYRSIPAIQEDGRKLSIHIFKTLFKLEYPFKSNEIVEKKEKI